MHLVSVKFRGGDHDVQIDKNGGYEADTNAWDIDWHFYGLSHEQHDSLALTDEEEADIYRQLTEALSDTRGEDWF